MTCRFPLRVSLVVAALALISAAAFAADPITVLDGMIKQLREVQGAVQTESGAPPEQWQATLGARLEPAVLSVNDLYRAGARKGQTVPAFALRFMLNNLRSSPSPGQAIQEAERIIQVLSFLRGEYQLAAQKAPGHAFDASARAVARETLQEILDRAEFKQTSKPHFFEYYVNRNIVRAMAWLQSLFDEAGLDQAGRYAALFLWGVYGFAAVLVAWLVFRAWSPRRRVSERTEAVHGGGIALQTPGIHLGEAEEFARQGNFAAAIRAYFLMMLSSLEQRNLVARNRTWTNWEYHRAFASRVDDDSLRGRMSQLNRDYDTVSYGGQSCDRERYTHFRNEVDGFLSALPATDRS